MDEQQVGLEKGDADQVFIMNGSKYMSKTATIHVIRHFPTTGSLLMGDGAAALLKDSHQSNADSVYLTGRPTVRN